METVIKPQAQPTESDRSVLSAEELQAVLKAVADPSRMAILERISAADTCATCTELHDSLCLSPSTISHHIKELEAASLIDIRREGKFAHLSLRRDTWQAFLKTLHRI